MVQRPNPLASRRGQAAGNKAHRSFAPFFSKVSPTVLPVPGALATAFVEMVEGCDFDWPESLGVDSIDIGIAEIAAAALVLAIAMAALLLARFVVLAGRTIS
jgi:hypothetical protein